MRCSTSEPAAPTKVRKRGRLYRQQRLEYRQRHRPSYTVSPAGQRLKRSRPAVGAAQAVGRHKKSPADEAREASWESQKEVSTDKNYRIYFKECQYIVIYIYQLR